VGGSHPEKKTTACGLTALAPLSPVPAGYPHLFLSPPPACGLYLLFIIFGKSRAPGIGALLQRRKII